jgi:hypothetical protein
MQNLRFLLVPFTTIAWSFAAYYSFFLILVSHAWLFSLHWIALCIGWLFFVNVAYFMAIGLPSVFMAGFVVLYQKNKFTALVHSILGLLGVILIYRHYYMDPPTTFNGNEFVFVLDFMWAESQFKTISLMLSFLGFLIAHFYSFVIAPTLAVFSDETG